MSMNNERTEKGLPSIKYGQGVMEETAFGARRESNEGRGRFDLLPYEAMEALAKWYEAGAVKYGDRNWENGISVKDCINRMVRHAIKAANGWTDEDHLSATMWNAAAAITMMQRRPDCNDHIWKDENGMEFKKPLSEFMAKEFNIPADVLNKQPELPTCYVEAFCQRHIDHQENAHKLRCHLEELLRIRETNGVLSWLETRALHDVCCHIMSMDMSTMYAIPTDLQEIAEKELETLS